jgi:signal transduction histidine kinase
MMAKLEQELSKLKQGDHVCSVYENTAEQLAVAVPFISDGLARGERCVYITDDHTIEEIAHALEAAGVDVEQERQRGALWLLSREDIYLRGGEFLPLAIIDFIRQAEAQALADGFSGLRLTGEMTWALLPEPGYYRLIDYEALLNQSPANSKSVILCQYNRSRLDAPCIHDVLRTHPLAILGDQICSNPYYEPPEMILGHGQIANSDFAAKRVNWWISQLKRAQSAEQEREQLMNRLKSLSHRLLEVQEEERLHLARELHDEFGQILSASAMYLQAARVVAGEAARPRLDACAALLRQAGEQVRSLSLELRPPMLDSFGLEATLRWLAEQHQQATGCEVQVVGNLPGTPLSPEMAIACFRVAQESLTNVARHAAAQHVWIELSQRESMLTLVVRDDGVGFEVSPAEQQAATRESLGLLGMAERVKLLGGTLQVESEPGRGTQIRASFPVREVATPKEPTDPLE